MQWGFSTGVKKDRVVVVVRVELKQDGLIGDIGQFD